MEKLQEFQSAARDNGFLEVSESDDGTTVWFRKATPDAGTDSHTRLCIDSLTNSANVFWATLPWKINSKTFRTVSGLQEWFALTCKQAATMTNREALLRLSTDKSDGPAMTSLCENNAEIIRMGIVRYFKTGAVPEKAQSVVMQRVAEHARSYQSSQDPDQWLAQCVNSECDRLRNEAIQEKANKE